MNAREKYEALLIFLEGLNLVHPIYYSEFDAYFLITISIEESIVDSYRIFIYKRDNDMMFRIDYKEDEDYDYYGYDEVHEVIKHLYEELLA